LSLGAIPFAALSPQIMLRPDEIRIWHGFRFTNIGISEIAGIAAQGRPPRMGEMASRAAGGSCAVVHGAAVRLVLHYGRPVVRDADTDEQDPGRECQAY
jgi:hypothetical protein